MKKIIKFIFPMLILGLVVACKNEPKGQKVESKAATSKAATSTATAKVYNLNTAKSDITWTGTKPTGQHQGKLSISQGTLSAKNGAIESGNFTLDMNSIRVTDLKEGDGKEDLEGHLKNGDFFEVENYPTGKFVITGVSAASGNANITHNITGNLTMKGITKSVTIPANVAVAGNMLTAVTPAFKINRTDWGIKYKSGIIGTAKDKLINDDISLVINLVANAQ